MEDDFKMTPEEVEKLRNAMKKKEFRDLLVDYVKEIEDPENKKIYEEEMTELEKMRGENVKFLNPNPGFVIKLYLEPGRRKMFVNIATSNVVPEATSDPAHKVVGSKKKTGSDWHVPYTLASPRDDLDKSGKRCKVYDCVFHPTTYKRGQKDPRFKQLLVDTAVDAVEKMEGGKAAPEKVKVLNLSYKGTVQPAVVRRREKRDEGEGRREGDKDPPFGVVYPPLPTETSSKERSKPELTSPSSTSPPEPVYSVKYRGGVAMGDFTNDRVSPVVKRPKEIVVTVQLPGLTSVESVELDVTEKQLLLGNKHPPYHLDLALSYPVDANSGNAEFDKNRKWLTVTLPVLPSLPSPPPHTITKSHDLPNHESSNQVAELGSHDTETQESTNQIAEPESHDLESQVTDKESRTSTNEVAEVESRDLESGELTNQIAVSEDLTQPTKSETVTTSSADSTNHSAEPSHVTWTSRGEWVAPSFTYRQDDERVVFVLHSPGTKPSTLVHHHDNHQFQVMYSCSGEKDVEQTVNYSLLVRFHVDDLVDNTSVDVSEENVVVVVTKAADSQREWAWFEAGVNSQSTQRKMFLTEENVVSGEEVMRQDGDTWRSGSEFSEVKVSSSSDTQLVLELKKKGQGSEPGDEEWNGDTVDRNRDRTEEKAEELPATRSDQNGDCASEAEIKRGHETRDIHLTNDLLFNLD